MTAPPIPPRRPFGREARRPTTALQAMSPHLATGTPTPYKEKLAEAHELSKQAAVEGVRGQLGNVAGVAAMAIPSAAGASLGAAATRALGRRALVAGARRGRPGAAAGLRALGGEAGTPAALRRAAINAPGAIPGAAAGEYGYQGLRPGEEGDFGPGAYAALAGGAEGVVQAATVAMHPAGKLALWAIDKVARGKRLRIPGMNRSMGRTRAGAEQAVEMFDRAARAGRGEGGYISVGQGMESWIIEQIEGSARASLMGGPLKNAALRGEGTLTNELWEVARNLAANSSDDALRVLEAVIEESGQVHRAMTRSAYGLVDEGLDQIAAREGGQRLMVDMRQAIRAAEKWVGPERPGMALRQSEKAIYETLLDAGDFVKFEDADMLQSLIAEVGPVMDKMMPGRATGMARRVSHLINESIDRAGKDIPIDVRYEWVTTSARSGAQTMTEVADGPTVKHLLDTARQLSREGKEAFNESMLAPAMRAATPEQFDRLVLNGIRSPAMLRTVRQTIFDPRYANVVRQMGDNAGVQNLTAGQLWDGLRGQWLSDQLIAATGDTLERKITGNTFLDILEKRPATRLVFPELFNTQEQGIIRDLGRALARTQRKPESGPGAKVMMLMQFHGLASIVSPSYREQTGETPWQAAIGFILAPAAIARLVTKPAVARMFIKGVGGDVAATGMTRWLTQMMRVMYQEDIPFTAAMGDGTQHAIDPEERKRQAFGGPGPATAIPTP